MNYHLTWADDELVVVVKPAGLLSVPGRGPDKQDCLWHRVQRDFPTARCRLSTPSTANRPAPNGRC